MPRLPSYVVRTCLVIAALFLTPSCEEEESSTPEQRAWLAKHLTGTWKVRLESGETAELEMRARIIMNFGGGCSSGYGAVRWLSTAFACGEDQPARATMEGKATSEVKHLAGALTGRGRLRKRVLLSDEASVELTLGDTALVGHVDGDGTMRGTAKKANGADLGPFEAQRVR
jgi:hypothetical protein